MSGVSQKKCICGAEIEVPLTKKAIIIRCVHCGLSYKFDPAIEIIPELCIIFKNNMAPILQLRNSYVVGRNDDGFLTFRSQIDASWKQVTTIRNLYLSRNQAKIEVKCLSEVTGTVLNNAIVERKNCIISDCSSKYGTSINELTLRPNETKELKHGDSIVLAVNSPTPLELKFKTNA
jgi:hypothetical protein